MANRTLWDEVVNSIVKKLLRIKKGASLHIETGATLKAGSTSVTPAELALLSGLTATAAELNQAADVSGMFEIVTAANVIAASENGKTFFLNNATGFASTLPAPAIGLRFTFINMTANTSGNHTVTTDGSANVIKGNQNSVAGDAGDTGTGDDTVNFVANNSLAGDKLEVYSDGTSWFAYAISRVAAGMTFTTAS